MPRDERLLGSLPSATSTEEPPAVATLPCIAALGQALKLLATTATQSNWIAAMPESVATLDILECTPMGTKLSPDGVIFSFRLRECNMLAAGKWGRKCPTVPS